MPVTSIHATEAELPRTRASLGVWEALLGGHRYLHGEDGRVRRRISGNTLIIGGSRAQFSLVNRGDGTRQQKFYATTGREGT